jgi:hypothetical protein
MAYQNISAVLSGADVTAIKDAITTINSKLPFLVALTAPERRTLFKLGDKSLTFVQDALTAAQDHPEILPSTFNVAEFAKDVALFTALSEILALLQGRVEAVLDTTTGVGNECMRQGTQFYDLLKAAAKTTPGLDTLVAQLGARFQRPPSPTPPPPPGP